MKTKSFRVSPPWNIASTNNFTVVATMPPDTTKVQFEKMLQNLLVERFHLVHHETRNFTGYELVMDSTSWIAAAAS